MTMAHPAQYLIRSNDESIILLKTHGTIIGLLENVEYTCREESISTGDILLFFTDGIYEVFCSP
ncbi:MAG: hypothetical protein A2014_02785 [Spirochaetes bacterium GWF1_49_6]|nr:MAG: hypothetical protein A2014_02785 [Spirochaetes bacterium GWF1_49_6]